MKIVGLVPLAAASVLLVTAGVLHANVYQPSEQAVLEQIKVMEKAVKASSVTVLFTDEEREAKLELVKAARGSLEEGNHKTALNQLDQAARRLYSMADMEGIPLRGDKQLQWITQMDSVIRAVMPVAREIALEKGTGAEKLDQAASLHEQARRSLEKGELEGAEQLMTGAYEQLQATLVALRTGDNLVIVQPEPGTERAWVDAKRRYEDWRYFADWMTQTWQELGVDPDVIAEGTREAEGLYEQARALAERRQWERAEQRIDQAYLVMESHWREAGIDI